MIPQRLKKIARLTAILLCVHLLGYAAQPAGQPSALTPQEELELSSLATTAQQSLNLFSNIADKQALDKRKQELIGQLNALKAKAPHDPRIAALESALTSAYDFLSRQLPATSSSGGSGVSRAAVTSPTVPLSLPTLVQTPTSLHTQDLPAQHQEPHELSEPTPHMVSSKVVVPEVAVRTTPVLHLNPEDKKRLAEFMAMTLQEIVQLAQEKGATRESLEGKLAALHGQTNDPQEVATIEQARTKINEAFSLEAPAEQVKTGSKGSPRPMRSKSPHDTGSAQDKGLDKDTRLQLRQFIALVRQEPHAVFEDQRLVEAQYARFKNKVDDLRREAGGNKVDRELLDDVTTWLETAYQAHKPSLTSEKMAGLSRIMRASQQELFPAETVLTSPSEQAAYLESRAGFLRATLNEWMHEATSEKDKLLVQQALEKVDSAYQAMSKNVYTALSKQPEPLKVNGVVKAIIGEPLVQQGAEPETDGRPVQVQPQHIPEGAEPVSAPFEGADLLPETLPDIPPLSSQLDEPIAVKRKNL